MTLRSIHTVIITPDWAADIGARFDPARFVDCCSRAGVSVVEFYTKNAFGHALLPFPGRPCPRDWATETRGLARQAGLTFHAYYNVGLDSYMATRHPELSCVDAAGNPGMRYGGLWHWMCLRSPWLGVVLEELEFAQHRLTPDAFWLDLLGGPTSYSQAEFDVSKACHCRHCKEAYEARFGQPMPAGSDDPTVRRGVFELAQESRVSAIRAITQRLHALAPGLPISYNHAGQYWDTLGVEDRSFTDAIAHNSLEAKPHQTQVLRTKELFSRGKPFEIMTFGCFQTMKPGGAGGTWIDWNLIPPSYQEVSGAIVAAHGGRYVIGVNLPPDGQIRQGEFDNISRNFAAIKEREPWLADIQSVPNVAVVYDRHSELLLRSDPADRSCVPEIEGLTTALIDAGVHVDIVHSDELDPRRYRAILCGDTICPTDSFTKAMHEFVNAGGLLLASGETSLWDASGRKRSDLAWANLLGVRYEGDSPHPAGNYCAMRGTLKGNWADYPLLFVDRVIQVRSTTASPLADLVLPEAPVTDETRLWATEFNHPGRVTPYSMVTCRSVGAGKAVYIAGPVGREIAKRGDPWLKHLVAQIVLVYATDLAIRVQAPPGVLVVLARKKTSPGGLVLSLVNRYGGMFVGTRTRDDDHPRVGPIEARIPLRVVGGVPARVDALGVHGMRWSTSGSALTITIDQIGLHGVIRIQ